MDGKNCMRLPSLGETSLGIHSFYWNTVHHWICKIIMYSKDIWVALLETVVLATIRREFRKIEQLLFGSILLLFAV